MLNEDLSEINIEYSSLTCTKYRSDKSIPTRLSFIFIEISLSLTYFLNYLILSNILIEEKKKKIKEILKLIHIESFINYISWSLRTFFILTFITSFTTSKIVFIFNK